MRTYIIVNHYEKTVEDVFLGNGDELTPAAFNDLRARLDKLGLHLFVRGTEPVSDLVEHVEALEHETHQALIADKAAGR